MSQSKSRSVREAVLSTFIGMVVALASQLVLFPLFGIYCTLSTDLWLTLYFTLISIVRSYLVRRYMAKGDGQELPYTTSKKWKADIEAIQRTSNIWSRK
jgi:hypothetical protein